MPSYKGKYFLKGSSARAAMQRDEADKSDPTGITPEDQPTDNEHVPSHKIEVHKHDDKSYHTITLHDDGNRTREDHPDLNAVKDHLDAHMDADGDGDADNDDDFSPMKESATALPSIKSRSNY